MCTSALASAHFASVAQVFDGIVRLSVIYKTDRAPKIIIFIHEIIAAILGCDHARSIPAVTFCVNAAMDVFSKRAHILHDELRLFEDVRVNAL